MNGSLIFLIHVLTFLNVMGKQFQSCENFNQFTCVPSGILAVLSFYENVCGEQYLQHMFTCIGEDETYCPDFAREMKVLFENKAQTGKLTYGNLAAKIPMECGTLLASDVDCIKKSVPELAACDMKLSIDIPKYFIICAHSDKTNTCVTKQCGSTVAIFYDELFKFLQCWQNSEISHYVDGVFSLWGVWSECTQSYGRCSRKRTRACNNPPPSNGGRKCTGNVSESQACNEQICPVDGVFSLWGVWSECTHSYGRCSRKRTRACNNPPPSNGGRKCTGNVSKSQACNEQICPVDGVFSLWGVWSECTQSYGRCSRKRTRTCTNPPPSNGRLNCTGNVNESQACNDQKCPVDGVFSLWGVWSECTQSYGRCSRKRTRTCNNPPPSNGGRKCTGNVSESQDCNDQKCPVEGVFSLWGVWSECTQSYGRCSRERKRVCNNPPPSNGGRNCTGNVSESQACNDQKCPVDGVFSPWGVWSECSHSYGGCSRERTRACNSPPPSNGGRNCTGNVSELQACNQQECPVDGVFSPWGVWSECSQSYGGCTQNRTRACNSPPPSNGGHNCTGNVSEPQACKEQECPVDGVFSPWGVWSECSYSYDGCTQNRTRECNSPPPSNGGRNCTGNVSEQQACNQQECQVDGVFSLWGVWSECTKSYGGCSRERTRACNSPPPSNGGHNCTGNVSEPQACKEQECPVDGVFSPWGVWSECSQSYGGCTQNRTRACNSPPPSNGGHNCTGNVSEMQACNQHECPVDGVFSLWGVWSECTKSYGGCSRERTRACNSPPPSNGGRKCTGNDSEPQACKEQECPVDGVFSPWGVWSECSYSYDGCTQNRTRECNSPPPSNGGRNCTGNVSEQQACNQQECQVDGVFSLWGVWSECTQSYSGCSRERTRACDSPPPFNGGRNCTGNVSEPQACKEQECPVDGVFSPWGVWTECTQSYGRCTQNRTRACNSPPPSNGGRNCTGHVSELQVCNEQKCPVNGEYGDWSQWGQCTGTKDCGSGVRTRSRSCDRPIPSNGGSDCSGPSTEEEKCYQKDFPVTSCAEVADHYGTWQETLVGSTLTLQCKKAEEDGSYSRRCGVAGIWDNVTGQCDIKSEIFDKINKQLEKLSTSENVSEEVENIIKNLTGLTNSVDSTTSGETIERVVETAKLIVSAVETYQAVTEDGSQSFFKLIDNIIKPETEAVWTDDETDVGGSDVFETVDRYLAVLLNVSCGYRNNSEISVYENTYLYTEVGKVQGDVKYPNQKQSDSYIEISAVTLSKKGVTDACFGGSSYKSIGNIVESYVLIDGSTTSFANGQEINSEVVSIQFPNVPDLAYSDLNPPVRVILKPINTNRTNPLCVFWDYSITGSDRNGAWSSSGCELVNVTTDKVICECSHLTNFAVLMSPWKIPDKHSFILSIISAVGCAISMVCLIITIAIHALVWRLVRSDRAIILMNLCVALLLALGVFLAGINRTESQKACTAIAAIIQILFLAVFFFMLLIGIEILICVVHVFGTKFRIKILLPVAWLAPVVIVGISLGVTKAEGYGNDRFCWLDIDAGLIWSFIGPAALVIFVNFIIVLVVFKKMASSSVLKSKSSLLKIQTGVRSLCVLLPLMGLTWVFGLLSVNSSFIFFPYLFCICNTLQGLFIFLFHCVFNRQVREALKRRQYRKRSLQTFSSDMRKQSRSLSKEMKTPTADLGSSESKKKGMDNRGYDRRYKRAKSDDYRPEDWDKFERKQHHKNIRRGSKLTA